MIPRLFLLLWGLAFLAGTAAAADDAPLAALEAPIRMLADAATGEIIYQHQPDLPIPPASLAKLMTLHLSMGECESGKLDENAAYGIPVGGRAADMRPRSGVLGLEDGDKATVLTLQRAAAVLSANDAAWSLALLASGDASDFVDLMNAEARRLGMFSTFYTDPDGWSEHSTTTGRDQMTMALAYLNAHPGVLEKIHSLPRMVYQEEDQLAHTPRSLNTNRLLEKYPGVDGLKTGTIPSAGYHFMATAQRGESRFIALVMGLQAETFLDGLEGRAEEAAALLDWAFDNYVTWITPEVLVPGQRVRHGKESEVTVVSSGRVLLTLERGSDAGLRKEIELPASLEAPLQAGEIVGKVRWCDKDRLLAELPLTVAGDVERRWRLTDFLGLPGS